ncbi:MAG TPA: LysR family transcriptional regulator [Polyangiaceae bacterium]|nr:LysR family transcriptional regulator [Polyangiaceae bacterium]
MDRLEAMAAFVAVADLRGFAAAARKLEISASAVTRLVASLEAELSARLLHRTTRSVSLTDVGARYLPRARAILDGVRDAEAAVRAGKAAPSGRFVVSAPLVFGRREVAPLLSDYLARHPNVTGELLLSDRIVNLVEEGVDAAVRIGGLEESTLRMRRVGATRRVLVASPRYLAEHGRPRRPADLGNHALIQLTPLTPLPEWRFHGARGKKRIPIRPVLVTNSADAAIVHAHRGRGIALVLSYQVADLLRSGELEILLPKSEPPPAPIYVAFPPTHEPSANVRAFIDLIVAGRSWDFASAPNQPV